MERKRPARVLCVDDDRVLQELISMTLELDGRQVSMASNGSEAMELLDQHAFDLIVLDLVMPVMDGLRLMRWLRQEKASAIPVLILSGVVREGMAEELKASGASEVLCKPVATPALLDQVRRLL